MKSYRLLGGSIGFAGSGMYSRSAHIFSKSSRKEFENSSATGTKEILQVVQNERKGKIFFLLCFSFGHSLAIFLENPFDSLPRARNRERQGLHNNHLAASYLKSPQIREEDKAKEIYLTKDELSALYDMPLEGFEEQVRDVFLIGCFTALRYSDYSRIKKDNIGFTNSGTKVIRIKQEKTARTVVIPILDERLETLLKKYDYNVPEVLDQSLNRTIKEICKRLSDTVPSLGKKERTLLNLKERRSEMEARKKGIELF